MLAKAEKAPGFTKKHRIIFGLLAALLLFMSTAQIASFGEFRAALESYDLIVPSGLAAGLLLSMQLIAVPALLGAPISQLMRGLSTLSVAALPLLWSIIAIQAFARSLLVENTGWYGGYFIQLLSWGALLQSVFFAAWGFYSYAMLKRGSRRQDLA